MNATQKAVNEARDIFELCDVLNRYEEVAGVRLEDVVDLCDLPTFGGDWDCRAVGVWSWDEENILVWDDAYAVVPRAAA